MHPLKTRVRAEILRQEFKGSLRSGAAACGVSKSSVASWCAAPVRKRSRAKRGPPGLHHRIKGAISDSVARNPLHNAAQISVDVCDATGIEVSVSTVYKSLKLLNMSYKLASRCRKHQAIDRSHPFFRSQPFASDAMAFDEAGFYINSVPSRGWSARGHRVPKAAIARSARLSLLLVTDRNGVVASRLLKGGVKGRHVAEFIATLPKGRPMILDNAAVHRSKETKAACLAAGITMNFLPPYSPWYNPVENAFAQAKAAFRRLRLRSSDFVEDIMESVSRVKSFDGMFESAHRMWAEDVSA